MIHMNNESDSFVDQIQAEEVYEETPIGQQYADGFENDAEFFLTN